MYKSVCQANNMSTSVPCSLVNVERRGAEYTKEFRLFARDAKTGAPLSFWHDIPMYFDKEKEIFNMVLEIPRWSNAKMEIATKEPLNPIKQDIKNDKCRFVHNIFPHHGYIWNYGAIPQTWEDPNHTDPETQAKGDNDPIDICEIGSRVGQRGDVIPVKILGVIALIDEGETDWKLIAIDVRDPLAEKMQNIDDVRRVRPGLLEATHEWFKNYKIPTGKPENQFGFNGEFKDREFAHKVIQDTHNAWRQLVQSAVSPGPQLNRLSVAWENAVEKMDSATAESSISATPPTAPATSVDATVDQWHFIV